MSDSGQTCSLATAKIVHDLIASIEHRPHQLLVELPEPWHRLYSMSPHFDPKLTHSLLTLARSGHVVTVNGFAPDPEYSLPGFTRIFYLRARPDFSYLKLEFLLPSDKLSTVIEQVIVSEKPEDLFPSYRVLTSEEAREYFICSHAERDHCCGLWGRELYEHLRMDSKLKQNKLRIFRCTHIGGHRYAPTMFELASMAFWGQLNEELAWQIMLRSETFAKLAQYYRGNSVYKSPLMQIAERETLKLVGWDWFKYEGRGMQIQENEVTVSWYNSKSEKLLVEIEKTGSISLVASCEDVTMKSFPQYQVRKVQRLFVD